MGKELDEEKLQKVMDKKGFAVVDTENKNVLDTDKLVFFWLEKGKKKPRTELQLNAELCSIQDIYAEKYGETSSHDLHLLRTHPGRFIDRLIRAVEICTLKYVLNRDGGLNLHKKTIVLGESKFHWEDDILCNHCLKKMVVRVTERARAKKVDTALQALEAGGYIQKVEEEKA